MKSVLKISLIFLIIVVFGFVFFKIFSVFIQDTPEIPSESIAPPVFGPMPEPVFEPMSEPAPEPVPDSVPISESPQSLESTDEISPEDAENLAETLSEELVEEKPIDEKPIDEFVEEPFVEEEPIEEVVEEPVGEEPSTEFFDQIFSEEGLAASKSEEEELIQEVQKESLQEELSIELFDQTSSGGGFAEEEPVEEEPIDEEPVGEEPIDEEPVGEEPIDEETIDEEPIVEEPIEEEPIEEEPVGEEPIDEEPVGEELSTEFFDQVFSEEGLADEEPVDEEPIVEEPIEEEPIDEEPVGEETSTEFFDQVFSEEGLAEEDTIDEVGEETIEEEPVGEELSTEFFDQVFSEEGLAEEEPIDEELIDEEPIEEETVGEETIAEEPTDELVEEAIGEELIVEELSTEFFDQVFSEEGLAEEESGSVSSQGIDDLLLENSFARQDLQKKIEKVLDVKTETEAETEAWNIEQKSKTTRKTWLMTKDFESPGPFISTEATEATEATEEEVNEYAADLIYQNWSLFNIDEEISEQQLIPEKINFNNNKWYVDFSQHYEDTQIYGSGISVVLSDKGEVLAVNSNFKSGVNLSIKPTLDENEILNKAKQFVNWSDLDDSIEEITLFIYPKALSGEEVLYEHILAYQVRLTAHDPHGKWVFLIDANSGDLLLNYNEIFFAEPNLVQIWGDIFLDEIQSIESFVFPNIKVDYNNIVYFADVNGILDIPDFSIDDENTPGATLENSALKIFDDDSTIQTSYNLDFLGIQEEIAVFNLGEDFSLPARTAYYFLTFIYNYFNGNFAYSHAELLEAYVNSHEIDDFFSGCVSYYDTEAKILAFGRGGCGFSNMALSKDILFHEYTHHVVTDIHQLPNIQGSESGAMNEGLADYFACSLNEDPVFGENFILDVRFLENVLTVADWQGDIHFDSQIFSGALWDLRKIVGQEVTDELVYNALFAGRENFEDFMYQLIIEDDDNNNLDDGTPHLEEILTAFEKHGIGPGVEGFSGIPELPGDEDTLLFASSHPSIFFTITNSSIDLGTLSSTATTADTATTVYVTTNAKNGFEVHIKSEGNGNNAGLYNGAVNSLLSAVASSAVIDDAGSGYGVYAENASNRVVIDEGFDNDGVNDAAISRDYQKIFSVPAEVTKKKGSADLRYTAVADSVLAAGNYSDTITIMVFATW